LIDWLIEMPPVLVFLIFGRRPCWQKRRLLKLTFRDLKHVRRQRNDDSQNKHLQINYCMNWVQFEEIKTKALWLKTLLLSKFIVSFVASWHVCVVYMRRENLWFAVVKSPDNIVSNSSGAFNYSFLLYEIRNTIVWIAVVVALPSFLLKVPITFNTKTLKKQLLKQLPKTWWENRWNVLIHLYWKFDVLSVFVYIFSCLITVWFNTQHLDWSQKKFLTLDELFKIQYSIEEKINTLI
jgi:hypothetical protein